METRAHYIVIGLFTIGIVAAAFAFVWWFSNTSGRGPRIAYDVVFNGAVSGLQTGSPVTFNGIPVGQVTALGLDPQDPRKVVATIAVEANTPIRIDTRATLDAQLLTGLGSIGLIGGAQNAPPLPDPPDGRLPRLEANTSAVQDLVRTAREVMGRVEDIATRVDGLLRDNQTKISSVIENVDRFSKALGDNAGNIDTFLTDIGGAAQEVRRLASSLDRVVTSFDPQKVGQTVDEINRFTGRLDGMATKFDQILTNVEGLTSGDEGKGMFTEVAAAAAEVRKLAANLDVRTAQLATNLNKFTGPGLRQYEALAAEGRRTLAEIERVFRNLERNPRQFLFGGSSVPGYTGR